MTKSNDHDKAFKVRHSKVLAEAEAKGHRVIVTTQTMKGTTWQKATHKMVQALADNPNRAIVVYTNADNPHIGELEAEARKLSQITMDPADIRVVALPSGRTQR